MNVFPKLHCQRSSVNLQSNQVREGIDRVYEAD